jgi:L-lactate dehydrogenase complex protein LldG
MGNRNEFLGRVKAAAEQGRQYRVHVQDVAADIGYVGVGSDLVQRFAEEVTAVGGQAFVVANVNAARAKLAELVAEAKAASALCWQHELLDSVAIRDLLADKQIKWLDAGQLQKLPPDEQRKQLLACDVGITSCEAAIAETGTLMMLSRPGRERLASLIAPVHIAIIERCQIVPDLIDAFNLLSERGIEALPSNVTFITGPSKTGDIELQLTTGVHGPGVWQVIIIDEPAH